MIIKYLQNNELINSDKTLTLYDFGDIKGFLYENEFKMFKILNRNDFEEICEEFYGNIPLHVFSIETYNCIYENNIYKTNNLFIHLEQQHSQPLVNYSQPPQQPFQTSQQHQKHHSHREKQQPRQQQQQPRQLQVKQQQPFVQVPQHQQHSKKSNFPQHEEQTNEKYKRKQQGGLYLQQPLVPSNAGQQWMSLEGLMKLPLPGVVQEAHSQLGVRDQNSVAWIPSLRVRPAQQKPVIQHQETTY